MPSYQASHKQIQDPYLRQACAPTVLLQPQRGCCRLASKSVFFFPFVQAVWQRYNRPKIPGCPL